MAWNSFQQRDSLKKKYFLRLHLNISTANAMCVFTDVFLRESHFGVLLQPSLSNFAIHLNHLELLLRQRCQDPVPGDSDSIGLMDIWKNLQEVKILLKPSPLQSYFSFSHQTLHRIREKQFWKSSQFSSFSARNNSPSKSSESNHRLSSGEERWILFSETPNYCKHLAVFPRGSHFLPQW